MLCGGKSARMGRDKANLPFGPETLLQRVVRLVGETKQLDHVVVVAGRSQQAPPLPPETAVLRDDDDYLGPLSGVAIGMRALVGKVDAAYATGCDVPLLAPKFVERLFELLGDNDAVVPSDAQGMHPLSAVYRVSVLDRVESLLAAGERSLRALLESLSAQTVDAEQLRQFDPRLASLRNVNSPEEYVAALAVAGLGGNQSQERLPRQREAHAGQ